MAARTSMAYIIEQVRLMISDPSGVSAHYSDEQIQGALDDNREDVDGSALTARLGDTEFVAGVGWWEVGATLADEEGNSLTPSSITERRGAWTFAVAQSTDVLLTGSNYDVYAASADLLDYWVAALVQQVDEWSADGMSVKRSAVAKMQALAASYRSKARGLADSGIMSARLVRTDAWAV